MVDLILEIYSEEIPASQLQYGSNCLEQMICAMLAKNNIKYSHVKSHYSPRRLGLFICDINDILPQQKIDIKGPKIDAPTSAINGFLKSNNVTIDDLEIRNISNKEVYFYSYIKESISIKSILEQEIPDILANFPWKKSMRWGDSGNIRWIRPILNIMCVMGKEIIDFKFGNIISNDISYGHFFMNNEKFKVTSKEQYCLELEKRQVLWDHEIRKNTIKDKCNEIASNHNLNVINNQNLLDEIVGLVEFPNPLLGKINQKYMILPEDVIITSMRINQKYICLKDNHDKLSNYFIVVANICSANDNIIIAGNERVINARLEDALFFLHKDLSVSYEENLNKLKKLTFHQKLGSVFDKVERMQIIAKFLAAYFSDIDEVKLDRAVLLCKTDLVTEMVGEFPELQGKMAGYYALEKKEDILVADAMKNHYLPQNTNDLCPAENMAIIVSLADKIDSLIGLWIAGEKPTGSKDPFALRRAAISIIRIIIERELDIDLKKSIEFTVKLFKNIEFNLDVVTEIDQFIKNRFSIYMKNFARHDIINAVSSDLSNIYQNFRKISAIQKLLDENNLSALQQYIRVINIINAESNNMLSLNAEIDINILSHKSEIDLYEQAMKISPIIINLIIENKYYEAILLFNEISVQISDFFDNVKVSDENQIIKKNRLSLLVLIKNLLLQIADFSFLELRIQDEA
jgi:glycyl-tRNA synthetase beta chain